MNQKTPGLLTIIVLFAAVGANAAEALPSKMTLYDDMLIETPSTQGLQTHGARKLNAVPWEDGLIPVTFKTRISARQKAAFFDACRNWEQVAHIKCIEGHYKGRTLRVTERLSKGCWALWGMGSHTLGTHRRMNLGPGCWNEATITHELGHALGLIHEQQRPDRDRYVTIHPENLDKPFTNILRRLNFDVQESEMLTPYDFLSIMHYPRAAFSKNGADTITPLPPYEAFGNVMGRVRQISVWDAYAVQAIYGAPQ